LMALARVKGLDNKTFTVQVSLMIVKLFFNSIGHWMGYYLYS